MNKNVKLNTIETLLFWSNYIFIMLVLSFIFIIDFSEFNSLENIPKSFIIYLVIVVLFLIHKLRVRRYTVINKQLTDKQFKEITMSHNLITNQEKKILKPNLYVSINNTLWQWEGIRFTVKKVKDKIYINSMQTPSYHSNPFSFFFAKNNKTLYLSLINDILEGKDIIKYAKQKVKKKELKFWNDSEWDVPSVFKRIFMYSIFLISLYFSFYIFENIKAITILIPLVISGNFIFWDIIILLTKRDLKKENK